jgi:hypothetical protein
MDGILIDQNGVIAAMLHGATGQAPAGMTFRECDLTGLVVGQTAPPAIASQIAPTDSAMARVTEDLLVALIKKGTLAKTDLPAATLTHINARLTLRGLATL